MLASPCKAAQVGIGFDFQAGSNLRRLYLSFRFISHFTFRKIQGVHIGLPEGSYVQDPMRSTSTASTMLRHCVFQAISVILIVTWKPAMAPEQGGIKFMSLLGYKLITDSISTWESHSRVDHPCTKPPDFAMWLDV